MAFGIGLAIRGRWFAALLERQRLVCGRVVRGARELRRRLGIDDRSGLGGRGLVGGSWQVGVRVAKWS